MKVIPLTRDKYTIVDDEDYDNLMKCSWEWVPATGSAQGAGYAVRSGRKGESSLVQMHRDILGLSRDDKVMVDHINRDSLDNRKENLRLADVQKNAFNKPKPIMDCTSQFKGVFMRQSGEVHRNKWTARIKFNGRHVELGVYDDEETAAGVYNFASRIFFGRYRCENTGVDEISWELKQKILDKAQGYIERYGWYVDTEMCRSFLLPRLRREA